MQTMSDLAIPTIHWPAFAAANLDLFSITVFAILTIIVGTVLLLLSELLGPRRRDPEKETIYECGVPLLDSAREPFTVKFYLVAILFIIFDLEVAFLFPWAVSLGEIGLFGFWSMVLFLTVLTVGFIYEWRRGALEWE